MAYARRVWGGVWCGVCVCVYERERCRQEALIKKGKPETKKGHKRYIFYSLLLL